MSRFLHLFNLLGVLALSALCLMQWWTNRELNLKLIHSEQVCIDHSRKLLELEKTCAGQGSDLESLQTHLARLRDELHQTAGQLDSAQRDLALANAEREPLKSSLTNWATAVEARDKQLAESKLQLQLLTAQRNDSITSFNELAERHNKLVKEWNQLQEQLRETSKVPTRTKQ